MNRKSLIRILKSVFFGLALGGLITPVLSPLADSLYTAEQHRRLGAAVALLKVKADRYRGLHGAIPTNLKDLLDFDKNTPPYFDLKSRKLKELVNFVKVGEENNQVTWEGFRGAQDSVALVADEHHIGRVNVRVGVSSSDAKKCVTLASMFLADRHQFSARGAQWYDSFRISHVTQDTIDELDAFETRVLTLELEEAPAKGVRSKNFTEAEAVCALPSSIFKDSLWQIEWVGL